EAEALRSGLDVAGLPLDAIGPAARPGAGTLADARRAAPDFVFLWTTPGGLEAPREQLDFSPLADSANLGFLGARRVLVARAGRGGDPVRRGAAAGGGAGGAAGRRVRERGGAGVSRRRRVGRAGVAGGGRQGAGDGPVAGARPPAAPVAGPEAGRGGRNHLGNQPSKPSRLAADRRSPRLCEPPLNGRDSPPTQARSNSTTSDRAAAWTATVSSSVTARPSPAVRSLPRDRTLPRRTWSHAARPRPR